MDEALKTKILAATNGTQLGAILRCALGMDVGALHQHFVGKANVTSDGFLMCDFVDRGGSYRHGAFVGAISDLNRNIAGLGAHLSLEPAQQAELDALAASWIGKDWRPAKARG